MTSLSHDHVEPLSPKLVRKKTLAKLLDVSPRTINNWIAAGVIPTVKINRVVRCNVDAVLQALQRFERKAVQ